MASEVTRKGRLEINDAHGGRVVFMWEPGCPLLGKLSMLRVVTSDGSRIEEAASLLTVSDCTALRDALNEVIEGA